MSQRPFLPITVVILLAHFAGSGARAQQCFKVITESKSVNNTHYKSYNQNFWEFKETIPERIRVYATNITQLIWTNTYSDAGPVPAGTNYNYNINGELISSCVVSNGTWTNFFNYDKHLTIINSYKKLTEDYTNVMSGSETEVDYRGQTVRT